MQTIQTAWAGPMVALARDIGVDIGAPLRTYVAEGFANPQPGERMLRPDELNLQGLVSLQWEQRDELWLDGKLLWVAETGWLWDEVVVLQNDEARHYKFGDNGDSLVPCEQPTLQLASEHQSCTWLPES